MEEASLHHLTGFDWKKIYGYSKKDIAFYVSAPEYRPWDYWAKMPAAGVLLLAVDIPGTLATNLVTLVLLPVLYVVD